MEPSFHAVGTSGFGNQVILRHGNGYVSCYGHLSGYGPGIRKGTRVKQKQVIGYVGSTGLSTGPHLDYRLVKDGKFRNPLKETFPTGVPLRREEMESFQKEEGGDPSLVARGGTFEEGSCRPTGSEEKQRAKG